MIAATPPYQTEVCGAKETVFSHESREDKTVDQKNR